MSEQSISVTRGNPTEREAAAIAAAIEMHAAELAKPAAGSGEGSELDNWQRAALREGVEARRVIANVWGSAPVGPS